MDDLGQRMSKLERTTQGLSRRSFIQMGVGGIATVVAGSLAPPLYASGKSTIKNNNWVEDQQLVSRELELLGKMFIIEGDVYCDYHSADQSEKFGKPQRTTLSGNKVTHYYITADQSEKLGKLSTLTLKHKKIQTST